jgi:Uma2 family endonuclease
MVACDPTDSGRGWRERPALLFEILSEDTRRLDEREKRFAYLQIPSLQAYIRIEQATPEAVIERRESGTWRPEKLTGLDTVLSLPEIGVRLTLAEIYERLHF